MKRRILLKKTVGLARTGDVGGFENLYILTAQDTYGRICALAKEEGVALAILKDVYVSLYRQAHTLPTEEEDLQARVEEEIYRAAERRLGEVPQKVNPETAGGNLSEDQAATVWMEIEEAAGLIREEPEDQDGWPSYVLLALRITAALAVLVVTGVLLFAAWRYIAGSAAVSAPKESAALPAESVRAAAPVTMEAERQEPGWSRQEDGRLFYVTTAGTAADGPIALGKQILTFSRDGALTLIGSNLEVSENGNLSFDEDTKYEVKNGDVYRTDPETEEETCVIRNGHVQQADIRCGYLWYISVYQIPNSDQARTVISRALPDGSEKTEIYATENTLETHSFQVTPDWLYYLSDGDLFRMSLEDGETEYLARQVEYYFAWEDTAYYMKDRTLESVSRGYSYSGMEAGYRIDLDGSGFVLLNSEGEPPLESGSGEIQVGDRIYRLEEGMIASVRPAERRSGDYRYFIDESGTDRKIYRTDSAGSRSLVPQEGIAADSLCIAGEWLYYSARIAQYGDECDSRIYRVNLETLELETVGEPFRGYMKNLYYFENTREIYGEYIPSVALPDEIHGEIARISEDGMETVNDTPYRPESGGSDMLELVMAGEGRIFCLYHTCSYDGYSGQMAWESTEALVIELLQ